MIETIFRDYEIPYFIDQKRTMLHHPLVELIRSALEVIKSDIGAMNQFFGQLKQNYYFRFRKIRIECVKEWIGLKTMYWPMELKEINGRRKIAGHIVDPWV